MRYQTIIFITKFLITAIAVNKDDNVIKPIRIDGKANYYYDSLDDLNGFSTFLYNYFNIDKHSESNLDVTLIMCDAQPIYASKLHALFTGCASFNIIDISIAIPIVVSSRKLLTEDQKSITVRLCSSFFDVSILNNGQISVLPGKSVKGCIDLNPQDFVWVYRTTTEEFANIKNAQMNVDQASFDEIISKKNEEIAELRTKLASAKNSPSSKDQKSSQPDSSSESKDFSPINTNQKVFLFKLQKEHLNKFIDFFDDKVDPNSYSFYQFTQDNGILSFSWMTKNGSKVSSGDTVARIILKTQPFTTYKTRTKEVVIDINVNYEGKIYFLIPNFKFMFKNCNQYFVTSREESQNQIEQAEIGLSYLFKEIKFGEPCKDLFDLTKILNPNNTSTLGLVADCNRTKEEILRWYSSENWKKFDIADAIE